MDEIDTEEQSPWGISDGNCIGRLGSGFCTWQSDNGHGSTNFEKAVQWLEFIPGDCHILRAVRFGFVLRNTSQHATAFSSDTWPWADMLCLYVPVYSKIRIAISTVVHRIAVSQAQL